MAADVPFGWATADEIYGQASQFRLWLDSAGIAHVVAVPESAMAMSMQLTKVRVHHLVAELPEAAWQRLISI
ncbi:hypothetical protein HS041_33095 [Planomonospora sp. ID67723]|uniref:hypothetical protein n=1 Tax=Planomonospora sp. ID67723 TaxID=2738134 RepID=UPI0018C37C16|nr:hypothetical protein [Planomonospora sp. ID67723]MBG0832542.1 hypothetical protein [Planomonospora sp. ID67723]